MQTAPFGFSGYNGSGDQCLIVGLNISKIPSNIWAVPKPMAAYPVAPFNTVAPRAVTATPSPVTIKLVVLVCTASTSLVLVCLLRQGLCL